MLTLLSAIANKPRAPKISKRRGTIRSVFVVTAIHLDEKQMKFIRTADLWLPEQLS